MGSVIDLQAWRAGRRARPRRAGGTAGGRAGPWPAGEGWEEPGVVERLERGVLRLQAAVSRAARLGGVDAGVEDELLAIIGQVTMGRLADAARRVERLASRLQSRAGSKLPG